MRHRSRRRPARHLAALATTSLMTAALVAQAGTAALAADASPAASDRDLIESTLNLANNPDQEWTYDADADAWVLSIVSAVAYPELPDQQGVSVAVPGAYVMGIDTNADGTADVTAVTTQSAV